MAKFDPALLPPAPDLSLEKGLWDLGVVMVCGIDEAGRGALAGPVTAAAVVFPAHADLSKRLEGLQDSKQLTAARREAWAARIHAEAADLSVGSASPREIDRIGILPATHLAAERAVAGLRNPPDHLLLDYLFLPENPLPQTSLIKGDARSMSIAAASVLAKVERDDIMRCLDARFPAYGFTAHKGYGTDKHRAAILENGPSPVHRMTFAPMIDRSEAQPVTQD
ncbi:MAG: ribonuclease HII [Anaerolineales bacterium]|nr:ribonuclease HII [Anaerolineales bacterium]